MPGANAAEQEAVIALLSDPASHGGAAVERVTTHGAIIFLAGDRAWKLKRAVRFPYMDFSTAALRRAACEAELRLNRRTAPELYLAVVPVTRAADGALAIDGGGEPVDWLVAMRRFPADAVLDGVADRGGVDAALAEAIAEHVASFHAAAERRPDGGGVAAMRRVIDTNDAALVPCAPTLPREATAALTEESRRRLEVLGPLLERRRREGCVRLGHGDLHLANICLIAGEPRLFDALEFDERLITIDVLYDAAFLVMDLWVRGLRVAAHRFLGRYVERTGDLAGLALMPLFLSMRAAVRAHVSVAMGGADAARRARAYLALAGAALEPAPPCLIAVGGLSGTGKSTLALALAPSLPPAPGAVVLRSDLVRKRLAGLKPGERAGPEAYAPERTRQVYERLRRDAATALAAGRSAIVDAVHADPAERAAVEAVAARLGVPFRGIWLEAPAPTLVARVEARRGDASDADAAVVRRQLGYDIGTLAWPAVTATGDRDAVVDAARRLIDPAAA
ncbi:MAG: AAA family ATPase [Alphaproteobacteria bacterium]|nr:AAA family ATPase [Alphaproteobacteria bacterium]